MPSQEIITYLKGELASGKTRDEITMALLTIGWQAKDIEEAFGAVEANNTPAEPSAETMTVTTKIENRVTEKDFPISILWVFKVPIYIVVVSLVALLFGRYFPELLIALPIYLIANPLIRRNFHYSTEDKYFLVDQGVFSKKHRSFPYGVIQNVLVKQDIFDRMFGLASFSVENASAGGVNKNSFWGNSGKRQGETVGSDGNKVNIPGLKKDDAEALKRILLQKMKDNPMDDSNSGL